MKDRISLRAVEKVIDRLVNSKEQAEQRTETALQPLDINADGTYALLSNVQMCPWPSFMPFTHWLRM